MSPTAEKRVFIQAPCADLRPYVRRFLVVESRVAHADSHLPEVGLICAFVIRGACFLDGGAPAPSAALAGLWDTVRHHRHSADNLVVLTAFTPMGAAAFMRPPLDEFANTNASLDDTLGSRDEIERLHEQLRRAPNHARRVETMERFLRPRVNVRCADPLVAAAVSLIEATQARIRIEDIVRRVGLSQSALERRFRARVGASPRKFASIVRLQHVARLRAEGHDFATIAQAAGYFDQPHFNKDFRRATGLAPEQYFSHVGCSTDVLAARSPLVPPADFFDLNAEFLQAWRYANR